MKVVPIAKALPVQDVVDRCRELLAQAEAGEVRSIMYIAQMQDGSRQSVWSECSDTFSVLADATRLVHRLQLRIDEATKSV